MRLYLVECALAQAKAHAEAFNDVDAKWIMQIAEGNTLSR